MGQAPRLPGLARRRQARSPPRPLLGGLLQAASGQEDPGPGRRRPGGCPARPGLRDSPALRRLGESRARRRLCNQEGGSWVISFANHRPPSRLLPSSLAPHPCRRPAELASKSGSDSLRANGCTLWEKYTCPSLTHLLTARVQCPGWGTHTDN